MKTSPLILHDYFVTALDFSVNKAFDPTKGHDLNFSALRVTPLMIDASRPGAKQLTLNICYQPGAEENAPYLFSLEIVGILEVSDKVAEEKRQKLLEVNGASMLYGAAREILRSVSANSPFTALLLPSVSFYPPKEKESLPPESAKE